MASIPPLPSSPTSGLAAQLRLQGATHNALQNDTPDNLQGCLQFFLQRYRLRHTLVSLVTGLPLVDNRLTPELFIRAAQRAGLVGRVVKRPVEDINPHVLPAVLMHKNGRAQVLLSREGEGGAEDTFTLFDTFTGEKIMVEGTAALEETYSGFLILVRQGILAEMAEETRSPARQWFWSVLAYFRPIYWKVLAGAFVINCVGLVSSLFVMNVYDRVVPNAANETLWVLAIGAFAAYVFDFLFRQLRTYFVDVAGRGADIILGGRIYSQLLNLRLGQQQMSAGAFANQLRDYDSLRDFFTSGTLTTLVDIPFMALFLLVIFLLGGPLVLVPMVAIPIVIAAGWALQAPMKELIARTARDMDMKHGHLVETINALENIKAIGTQSHAQGRWEKLTGVAAKLGAKTRFLNNVGMNFVSWFNQVAYLVLIIWGVYRIEDKDMTTGALVACSMLIGRAMQPLSQVAGIMMRYEQSKNSMDNLTKLMLSSVERPAGKEFVHIQQLSGSITFDKINFSYPGSKLNSLQNISFTIRPGEKVGIIGRAGSGKSTIARLILGLYEPTEGSILLDGLELRQLDPAEVRKNVCYFPQNLHLFRGNLRENLLLANPNASDETMLQAVEVSGAYRLIRRHPMGFDLPVGERGELLSGGQRQAVGLARALMHDGTLAIFDDPTSEMDGGSEAWVKERLSKWLKNRTLILITHRPSMLDMVDRLLVIDEGKLVADGPKKQVLDWLNSAGKKDA